MIHPKFEQVRGIENNALLELGKQSGYIWNLFSRIKTNSNGRVNILRFFHLLAKQWTVNNYHTGLHAKPVMKNGMLNPDLHPSMVEMVHSILDTAEEHNMWILLDVTNRSAAQAMGIKPSDFHNDKWLREAHLPFIENALTEFEQHKNIIWETCNESATGDYRWEVKIAEKLKKHGAKFVTASPLKAGVRKILISLKSAIDFVCIHGLWMADWDADWNRYKEFGTKVWFSGDGKSELTGGKASRWCQFGEEKYGKLPSPGWHKRLIQLMAVRNNGVSHNMSGALEVKEPKWAYFDQCCKEYVNGFKL